MTTFTAATLTRTQRAPAVIVAAPSWFADSWSGRPRESVAIGLRRPSAADLATAHREAANDSAGIDDPEARVEAFNDRLIEWAVGLSHCDPNDATQPSILGEWSDEAVSEKLTSRGARILFDRLDVLMLESAPWPGLDDDGVARLCGMLADPGRWKALGDADARRIRRILSHVLETLAV